MRIAIIGLGEVGRCFAAPLHAAGFELSVCEARPSAAAHALAATLGVPIHPGPGAWLGEAQWVFSCVTGTTALPALEAALPHLADGASVADFTTASPAVKREAASKAAASGVQYVDTAIMSAISLNRVRTPLLVSGAGAADFKAILEQAGGRVQVIERAKAGDAISLKILRSVFTKGLEALCVELLTSAEKQGVRSELYAQLADIDQTPLRSFMDMLVRTHVVHARRRAHEVHDAQGELSAQGLPSVVLPGVAQRFEATVAALEKTPLPAADPTVEQALDWLLATATATA
ncbi:NAD(P)-binding domain-containing protein [Pseudacidovorax sp. NFM-22]|uniref:NAD(P)-binding domain-containing protein n=1 Tax=Pseudacidovorax sp. NFM-22 TaxID=2744469 RepID=UPI001F2B78BB|nr:NAD(P)-binding domain-containing protein [Pseudacidovorax sp. NFM-22]